MSAVYAGALPSALLTVERGLQVLRAFRSDRAPLGNAELVRRTGLPKATVSRLTSTLLQLGYLRHAGSSREFELDAAPLAIGHAYVAGSDLVRTCRPVMQALADRLGVSVALAAGNGQDMLYVAYRAGTRVATLRLGVGSVLPMATTAIGRAWLWGLSEGERSLKIAALLHAAGSRAAALDSGIRASFGELQGTGTCAVLGGYQRNAFGVALPVRIGRQRVVMGLSCGRADLQPDLSKEHCRITPALKDAALELEAALADFDGQP